MSSNINIIQAAQVIAELMALEAQGVTLPYTRKVILQMELSGHTVNLETGEVTIGGRTVRRWPTVEGVTVANTEGGA